MKICIVEKLLWKYVYRCLNNENYCLNNKTQQAPNVTEIRSIALLALVIMLEFWNSRWLWMQLKHWMKRMVQTNQPYQGTLSPHMGTCLLATQQAPNVTEIWITFHWVIWATQCLEKVSIILSISCTTSRLSCVVLLTFNVIIPNPIFCKTCVRCTKSFKNYKT